MSIPPRPPRHHWRLDDGYGTGAEDNVGSTRQRGHGRFSWSAWAPANADSHGSVDLSGGFFDVETDPVDLPLAKGVTVSLWFNARSLTGGSHDIHHLFGHDSVFCLRIGDAFSGLAPNRPQFLMGIHVHDKVPGSSMLEPGVWYHLAGVYDGTTATLYLNGFVEASKEMRKSARMTNAVIGKDTRGYGSNFEGRICDVRVFDRALSAQEIQRISKGRINNGSRQKTETSDRQSQGVEQGGAKRVIHPEPGRIRFLRNGGWIGAGAHRSGWPHAIESLKPLSSEAGLLFDDFIEQTWFYQCRRTPIDEPWCGILHHPPSLPIWCHTRHRVDQLPEIDAFRRSMPHCRLLITLSEHLASWVRRNWGLPTAVVLHPTALDVRQWEPECWLNSPKRRVLQVGYYLRNTRLIYQLPPQRGVSRARLFQNRQDYDRACRRHTPLNRTEYPGVSELGFVSNEEYDELLATSVEVVELIGSSANNGLIEAIARSTPTAVNRYPAAVEYFGEDYPLFWDEIDELPGLLHPDRVSEAHSYLTAMNKDFLRAETFRDGILAALQGIN